MLLKFVQVNNLALLHGLAASPACGQTTIIYAENGRGKSTLCALLRSLTTGDLDELRRRTTIDQVGEPSAKILFSGAPQTHELASDGWDTTRPNILIFDNAFVRDAVHSGPVVEVEHRRNLLRFALGTRAVTESIRAEQADAEAKALREAIREAESDLSNSLDGFGLVDFIALPPMVDADARHQSTAQALASAASIDALVRRPIPSPVPEPQLDLNSIFEVLGRDLDLLADDAEAKLRAHVDRVNRPNFEDWLRQGHNFEFDETCPYCAQNLGGVELIASYRIVFAAAYQTLATDLAEAALAVEECCGDSAATRSNALASAEVAKAQAWTDILDLDAVTWDPTAFTSALSELRAVLEPLIARKKSDPLAAPDPCVLAAERDIVDQRWSEVVEHLRRLNVALAAAATSAQAHIDAASRADTAALQSELRLIEATRRRHQVAIAAKVTNLLDSRARLVSVQATAEGARLSVRQIMDQTLGQYETRINQLLAAFGAGFKIVNMRSTFRGAAQSDYQIELRSREVRLTSDDGPDFDSALSEGDKRTLAFAFFVATALDDPQIEDKIVIVDDPMSSMDASRRAHTVSVLTSLATQASQLIVLGHDPGFLRDVRNRVDRAITGPSPVQVGLRRGPNGYSQWTEIDLDVECESEWLRRYRLVSDFLIVGGTNLRSVATALRPLLEGYLHRRFPGQIGTSLMLGQALDAISRADPDSPLQFAADQLPELRALNQYAGQFHHDTNPDADVAPIVDAEVLAFARRTLDVLHGRPQPAP